MLEIILKEVHVGAARRVATLEMDGHKPADDLMLELSKSAPQALRKMRTKIRVAAEFDHYSNTENFKPLGDGLYEFKISRPVTRLYAFYDELPDLGRHLIIITSGGDKRRQSAAIEKARELRATYLKAKELPDTLFRIQEIERNEDHH